MDEVVNTIKGVAGEVSKRSLGVRTAAVVVSVLALAALAKILLMAAEGGLALLGIGAVALVGIGLVQALPLLGQRWENFLIGQRKAAARKNPIEELERYMMRKAKSVAAFKAAVAQIGGQVQGLQDMLEARKQQKPGYNAARQEESLKAMREAHAKLVAKYQRAEAAMASLREVIDDKRFEWKFGQAGQAALQSMSSASGEDLVNEMLAGEAYASVRDNFNAVFAELDLEASRLSSTQQLSFGDEMTLDLSSISLPKILEVGREEA